MEQEIINRYNDTILQEAQQRFDIAPDQIKPLNAFESFLYEFEKDDRAYILRIGHSRRRTPDLIHGEVDWINYLAQGGAGVAKAILSAQGNLVEAIADDQDGHFLATAFVKARGGSPHQMGLWDDTLFKQYGRLLGRIHALSQQYQPTNPAWKRPEWDNRLNMNLDMLLPPEDTAVLARYQELMTYLQSLPKAPNSYGLIHQDAHAGNFFVDEQYNITLFDFDDCVYSWFVYDIAMVIFYGITNAKDIKATTMALWKPFMAGYNEENQLDPEWLTQIPYFLKLREIDLYAIISRDLDLETEESVWVQTFMNGRREHIAAGTPYVDFDFRK